MACVRQWPGRWRLDYCGHNYGGIEVLKLGPPEVWDPATSEQMAREKTCFFLQIGNRNNAQSNKCEIGKKYLQGSINDKRLKVF